MSDGNGTRPQKATRLTNEGGLLDRTIDGEWEKRRSACLPDQSYHAGLAVKDERCALAA